jgi:hypothetical protein
VTCDCDFDHHTHSEGLSVFHGATTVPMMCPIAAIVHSLPNLLCHRCYCAFVAESALSGGHFRQLSGCARCCCFLITCHILSAAGGCICTAAIVHSLPNLLCRVGICTNWILCIRWRYTTSLQPLLGAVAFCYGMLPPFTFLHSVSSL